MKSKYSSFIKLFVSIVIVSSALLIQSCSNSEIENLSKQSSQSTVPQNSVFKAYDKTYNTPTGLQIWEAQLNKAIEMDSNMVRDGLKLIRYEYIRQVASITDLETVKTELKNDNSSFIVYEGNSSHFSISENKEFAKSYSNLIDSLLPTSAGILEAIRSKGDTSLLAKAAYVFKKNDIGVVNLVWEYKGKTLNTQCLVSNEKGIVYDKFLFSIHTTVSKITSVQSNFSKTRQIALMTDGEQVQKNYRKEYTIYNEYGTVQSYCGISARIYGFWANGTCFATNFTLNNWAWSMSVVYGKPVGYNCATFIRPLYFSPTIGGEDIGHLQFDYAILTGVRVAIVFDASGIYPTFSGNSVDMLDAGTVTLTADEMNNYDF